MHKLQFIISNKTWPLNWILFFLLEWWKIKQADLSVRMMVEHPVSKLAEIFGISAFIILFFFIHPRSWRIALRTWSCFNAFWKRENKFIILYVYIFRREATSVLIVWQSQNHSFVDAMENLTPLFDIIPSLYVIFTQSAWPLVICLFSIRQQ